LNQTCNGNRKFNHSVKTLKICQNNFKNSLFCQQKILRTIYYRIVYSHLLYGILSWVSECKTTMQPFQIIQNKIMNNIKSDSRIFNEFSLS